MARIAGVNLPENKKIGYSLTYIKGIGISLANEILKKAKISDNLRTKDLSDEDIEKIRNIIGKSYTIEGDLRMMVTRNIKRLKEINSYRGIRHTKNLPVRGQRTKTNARTKRGKKVTVGSGRKAPAQKT